MTEKDERIEVCLQKERELRNRLKENRKGSSDVQSMEEDLKAQVQDVELECEKLQRQLTEREGRLQSSLARENELRSRLRNLRSDSQSGGAADEREVRSLVEAKEKTHAAELRGLAKQLQYFRVQCKREENFRKGLIFSKRFMLLQIEMYSAW